MTTPRPRWGSVTVDCRDPERLAAFWSAMLDTSVRGRWEQQYVHLHPTPGAPVLAFQRVDSKSPGKNALHLDVHVTDDNEVEPVVERALALGARLLARRQEYDTSWVVLLDPEDNEFCVIAVGPLPGGSLRERPPRSGVVDGIADPARSVQAHHHLRDAGGPFLGTVKKTSGVTPIARAIL